MLTRKTVILAKIETTYGTDPTPTPAANAILVSNVEISPVGELVERNYLKSSLSRPQHLVGTKYAEVSFRSELKGTGTRGQLPGQGWEGVLLRACGMNETISAGVSIVYAPESNSIASCTLYVYRDGVFHKVLGCRGSFRITGEVGKHLQVDWRFKGLYAAPTDASPSAQTFSPVRPPLLLSAGLTVGGYAAVAERIEIDMNNTVSERHSMNAATGIAGFEISERRPKGSFDPEQVTEATHAFWNNWETASALALNLGPLGSTSGNIVTLAAPKLQYAGITYGDRNGISTYRVPFNLAMNSGDDELTITMT